MSAPLRAIKTSAIEPVPAPLEVTKEAADPLPVGPADWIALDGFTMERQCHTRWCWAAVTQAVVRYYKPSTHHTQRTIAKLLMPQYAFEEACYTDYRLAEDEQLEYNQDQLLLSALLQTDCFAELHPVPDEPAPLEKVQKWIKGDTDGRRAVCVRIRWPNGKAHFVAITGYRPGTNLLRVWDPWVPQYRELTYDEVGHHYTSLDANLASTSMVGKWVDTHFTKRPAAARAAQAYRGV